MFKSYFKIAFRSLLKHRAYSFINIAGLAIGMACCIVILLIVQHQLSYDRFFANSDRLFRVVQDVKWGGGDVCPGPARRWRQISNAILPR